MKNLPLFDASIIDISIQKSGGKSKGTVMNGKRRKAVGAATGAEQTFFMLKEKYPKVCLVLRKFFINNPSNLCTIPLR